MLNNVSAIIFDMDGLLLDSETIALDTFVDSCKKLGFDLDDMEPYYRCIGTNWATTREILMQGYGQDFPLDAISDIWGKQYHRETLTKPVPMKEGALKLLQYLEQVGVKKAIVTSTRKKNALIKLTNAQILDFFAFVLGGDEITNGKPNPEMYLTATKKLNVAPDKCLAIEDSDNGVLAAFNAGLMVIQVPDLKQPSDEVKTLGHTIAASLAQVEAMLKESSR
jgi:HAD superfamily hydrolase (TIGR01509 family)